MVGIAINVLWFLIGLIILCGVIYLVIWVVEQFVTPIPPKIKQGIWVIVLLLAIIALLTTLLGGGGSLRLPSLRGEHGGTLAALSAGTALDLQGLLTGLTASRAAG